MCLALLARPDFTELNRWQNFGCTALHDAASKGLDSVCLAILSRPDFTEVTKKK